MENPPLKGADSMRSNRIRRMFLAKAKKMLAERHGSSYLSCPEIALHKHAIKLRKTRKVAGYVLMLSANALFYENHPITIIVFHFQS
jgi:hypothetical protein